MNGPNRRSKKTRQVLATAFTGLLLDEGYESVTMQKVATRARVGRSTLYLHFADKRELLRQSLAAPSTQLLRIVNEPIAVADLVPQLRHFHQQRSRNRVFLLEPIRTLWADFLADLIEASLRKSRRDLARAPGLPRRLIALQLAEMQLALIRNWLLEVPEVSEQTIAAAMIAGTRAQMAALARP